MRLFLLTSPLALLGSGARWLPDLSCSSVQPCSEVLCVHRGQSRLFSPWHYCLCATHIMPWDLQGLYRTFICQYKSEARHSYQEELQNNCFREAACLHYSREARLYFWITFNSLHPLPGTHECWRPLKSVSWHQASGLPGLCSLWKIPVVSTMGVFQASLKNATLSLRTTSQTPPKPFHSYNYKPTICWK